MNGAPVITITYPANGAQNVPASFTCTGTTTGSVTNTAYELDSSQPAGI